MRTNRDRLQALMAERGNGFSSIWEAYKTGWLKRAVQVERDLSKHHEWLFVLKHDGSSPISCSSAHGCPYENVWRVSTDGELVMVKQELVLRWEYMSLQRHLGKWLNRPYIFTWWGFVWLNRFVPRWPRDAGVSAWVTEGSDER